jgi:hypothetical protein
MDTAGCARGICSVGSVGRSRAGSLDLLQEPLAEHVMKLRNILAGLDAA